MDLLWSGEGSEERFAAYLAGLSQALGHADRVGPFRSSCTGLLLPGEGKSVEPMAARRRPDRTAAEHPSLLHVVGPSRRHETALLRAAREAVLPAMTAAGPVQAWIVVDTGFAKKGAAFSWRGAAGLRAVGQAGQLPGGGLVVGGDGDREPAGGVANVPSGELGGRCRASVAGGCARRCGVPEQAADRAVEWPDGKHTRRSSGCRRSPDTPIDRLAYLAKLRWLIERDDLELKQEIGLGHYEGRSWRGFHHHAALCIAAYGFLVAERAAIPPSAVGAGRLVQAPSLPNGHRPRGTATANRTSRPGLDRHHQTPHRSRPCADSAPMSVLRPDDPAALTSFMTFVTQ